MDNSETISQSQISKNPQKKYYLAKSLSLLSKPANIPTQIAQPENDINIFKQIPSQNDYKQKLGPKLDSNGHVIKHTLVGKVEWFLKQTNGKKINFDETFLKQAAYKQTKLDDDNKSFKNIDTKSVNKQKLTQDKKINRKSQLTTKGQILDEMNQKYNLLLENKQKEINYLNQLPELQKKYITKEQRIFDTHQAHQDTWNRFIEKASTQLQRDQSYSQLIRSDQFRKKLEAAQTFEVLKTDLEKFGPRIWFMTLRKSDNYGNPTETIKLNNRELQVEKEEKYPLIINEDLPSAFMNSSVNGMKQQIEYIRKPLQLEAGRCSTLNSMSLSNYSRSIFNQSCIPFSSFKSDQYLLDKMTNHSKKIKDSLMIPYDKIQEIDLLMVNGKNQFQNELEMVTRDPGDNTVVYEKFINKPQEKPKANSTGTNLKIDNEEIIEMRYSKQEQLKFPPVLINKKKQIKSQKSEKSSENNSLSISGDI